MKVQNIVKVDDGFVQNVLDETFQVLNQRDKPYILNGSVDGLSWKYRSKINELTWNDYPSQQQLNNVRTYLVRKRKVNDPKVKVLIEWVDPEFLNHYPYQLITEIINKNATLYLGWLKRTNLAVKGFDVEPNDETETHYNYLIGMPDEWRGEPDNNLLRWRYRKDLNIVYWWEFGRPNEDEKESVVRWLEANLGIRRNPEHRIIPTDTSSGEYKRGHGIDEVNRSERLSPITIDDIKANRDLNWEVKSLLNTVSQFYHGDDGEKKGWAVEYINLLNTVLKQGMEIGQKLKVPHFDVNSVKSYLLQQTEFKTKPEEFYPLPLYVSVGDEATVGILVDTNGEVLEIYEGNDEATVETNAMVNRLVNPQGKKVRVYGNHNTPLVRKIEETGYLPKGLYVSPHKDHAMAHWDMKEERSGFTGIIDLNSIARESDLDWKTLDVTKIDKFRWL